MRAESQRGRAPRIVAAAALAWALLTGVAYAQNDYSQLQQGSAGWVVANLFLLSSPLDFYSNDFGYRDSLMYSQALISVVQRQATTFPVGSSTGGFTYTFDPQLGLPVRRTQSFGPMFADRPLASGRHKFSINLTGQQTNWRAIGGVGLKNGMTQIRTYEAAVTGSGHPEAEYSQTKINFTTARQVLGLNYGLTNRIDVTLLLPYGSATADGTLHYTRTDLTTGEVLVVDDRTFRGSSAGPGDATIRGKAELVNHPAFSLAVGGEVRLPTGNADEMLGVGHTTSKVEIMGATTRGALAPHFNLGYALTPGKTPGILANGVQAPDLTNPDEIDYTMGADVAMTRSLTVAGDVIGRTLLSSFNFHRTVDPLLSQVAMSAGNVHLLLGAAGAKLLVRRSWLLNVSVAFPLNSSGLKPGVTPVIGLERAF